MAKKIILINLIIGLSLFLQPLSLSAAGWEGFYINKIGDNQINVSIDASYWDKWFQRDYWTIILNPGNFDFPPIFWCAEDINNPYFLADNAPIVLPSTTLNYTFTFSAIPTGDYVPQILLDYNTSTLSIGNICFNADGMADVGAYFHLTNALTPTITYPTSTTQSMLAKVSDTLSDNGFLYIIIAAAAIPLVFYVADQLIALIPKSKDKRK